MKFKVHLSRKFAVEIGLIFILWLVSVYISSSIFNRPLGANFEWLTGHTLVSMRAFEEWGFWKLLGCSIFLPKSYELEDLNLRILEKYEGLYLSYPSFWLILPYVTFKILQLLHLSNSLNVEFLQSYHLIFNRLVIGIVIYYLFLEIIKLTTDKRLSELNKRLIAFLGLLGWMFTPPVMYWTQNVYFSDQAVLLPIYALFLILLKCKFRLQKISVYHQFLLLLVSFLACGIDWYSWVAVAVIFSIVFLNGWIEKQKKGLSFKLFIYKYCDSIKFIFLGNLIIAIIFTVQLIYYNNGFNILLDKYWGRSGSRDDLTGEELSLFTMLFRIVNHWIPYFPKLIQSRLQIIDLDFKILTSINFIDLTIVLILILLWILMLHDVWSKSIYKNNVIYTYLLLFLIPFLQLILLKQHSMVHTFSAFKMALPITFSVLILPLIVLVNFIKSKTKFFNRYLTLGILVIGLSVVYSCTVIEVTKFAGNTNFLNQELGVIISKNIAANELPIADPKPDFSISPAQFLPQSLIVNIVPPELVWYTDRLVYPANELRFRNISVEEDKRIYNKKHVFLALKRVNSQNIRRMQPVFIGYKNESTKSSVKTVCQEKWENAGTIAGREVVICRVPQLRQLLN
ncbi:MAG: hypothetical protein KME64_25245 [Scytonematopsis contorta HA4267-MV1]|jgi:hypothetical protein|nr:hypothetical protein [Scytonematopsis contorta HA4267-MV1]